MKIKTDGIAIFLIMLCMLSVPFVHTRAYAETMFILNPEARVSEIEGVRKGIQAYLNSKGVSSEVFIFANPEDFQNSVGRLKPDVAIVASYYYNAMQGGYNWKALLSGYRNGEKTFSRSLVTPVSVTDPLQLKNKSLAMVSLGASALPYIESQMPSGLSVKDIRIVSVSKDIDAIMALGFEQVQAAVVTQENFEKLKQINPEAVKNLHILQSLNPVEFPKIAVFPNAGNAADAKKIFQEMSYEGPAKAILKFFDVTEFKP